MKCKHCGEEIANDSNFCEFCGAKVKTRKLPWWGVLLIVLGVAGGSFLIGQYSHGNDHSGETTEEPVEEVVEETPAAPVGYVDLGLSVYWKNSNEWNSSDDKGKYTYDAAVNAFGNSLPSKAQCEELINECEWTWTGGGYRVKGPSGNEIFLPATSYAGSVGLMDNYWSSTPNDEYKDRRAWGIYLGENRCYCMNYALTRDDSSSVRLVQSK